MSDVSTAERVPLSGLGAATGFRIDRRFAGAPHPEHPTVAEDAMARAYADGFAAGTAEAEAQSLGRREADERAHQALTLRFARLDASLEEELRLRLRDTVAALCESAIAPVALDREALAERVARCVAMLARADDERVIRLNPDDIALLSPEMMQQWEVRPDPSLDRGDIRVEGASGGVEDGPATWRQAIAEALHLC
ncbi:hypothetical protein GCM10011371_30560 [Novosphingobium marinum]|uniref:Flagellar assembly protein FliH n=1 Tax=Novosphingobium marinum TaxID=1514948 RepID=A0A7Y9XUR8_9SPHN|nr:FliH/SctL family protein [Novosphingobium marinum]NYH94991.1 flagellar assembly protein FliH [Novosphingobium marinum]GGC41006.1 hypothetical protein GCM10011371_30560 [Novosphingobium marinum]